MKDKVFQGANQVIAGVMKQMRRDGLDTTKHKDAIPEEDMRKLYDSRTLSNDNATSLLHKVFFELCLHFGRRGREGLRDLKKGSFDIKKDASGKRYVRQTYLEKEKNHQGLSLKEKEKCACMYEQPNSEHCPVKSFELYVSKLHPACDALFQKPWGNARPNDEIWYCNVPVGYNTLGNIMKTISTRAQLSQVYTNHCIRATCTTVLSHAGIDVDRIASVTGHRNVGSIRNYVRGPSEAQRREVPRLLPKLLTVMVMTLWMWPQPTMSSNLCLLHPVMCQ